MFTALKWRSVAHGVPLLFLTLALKPALIAGDAPETTHYHVTTTVDDPNLDGRDGGPLSLRGALRVGTYNANTTTLSRVVIHVPAGTYRMDYSAQDGFGYGLNVSIYGQQSYLHIIGAGREVTVIDGANLMFSWYLQTPDDSFMTFSDVTIANRRSNAGGAFDIRGNVTFENCQFWNCSGGEFGSHIGSGGAIFHRHRALNLRDCIFKNCVARQLGGAVYSDVGSVTAERCTFLGNAAALGDGGAIFARGPLQVSDSVFVNNIAGRLGGAIVAYGLTTVDHCTIVNNRSNADGIEDGNGGGIRTINSVLTLSNSIVAHNRNGAPGLDAEDDLSGRLVSAGSNIISAITEYTILDGDVANDLIEVDPLLGPLDTAEDLPFYPLRPGSPAIDAASG
ncbi:MAG: right-handed parallel beta-helix repeat-containing protein, partial [Phycisphaerae bacterium]